MATPSQPPPTIPLTPAALQHYSLASLDPHTLLTGLRLASQLTFSAQGQRNLASAFDSLALSTTGLDHDGEGYGDGEGGSGSERNFEVGFTPSHVLPALIRSEAGFRFAGIVGALGEWFCEDVAVWFLVGWVKMRVGREKWWPRRRHWDGVVRVLGGVLATSGLGVVLGRVEGGLSGGEDGDWGRVEVDALLKGFERLDAACRGRGHGQAGVPKERVIVGKGEAVWLAAVGEWLFGLRVGVVSRTGDVLYDAGGGGRAGVSSGGGEADVTIELAPTPSRTTDISTLTLSDSPAPPQQILGGRVPFDILFRTCFGRAFLSIPEDFLAASICCASILVRGRLDAEKPDWARAFLSQPSSSAPGGQGFGPADTLSAWFPELQRLSPRFRKYAKLSYEEAKVKFDETYRAIQQRCACPWCADAEGDGDAVGEGGPERPENCSVIIAVFLVGFSLILARTFVAPRLLPKKEGCVALLRRWTDFFAEYRGKETDPSDVYFPHVGGFVSSTATMIKLAAVVFANSTSLEIEREEQLMGITHGGLAILSTGQKDYVAADADGKASGEGERRQWKTAIQVSPGWLCLFGHEARLEVYVQIQGAPRFAELVELVAQPGKLDQLRQVMKWRDTDDVMLTSMVWKGSEEEKLALKDGWNAV